MVTTVTRPYANGLLSLGYLKAEVYQIVTQNLTLGRDVIVLRCVHLVVTWEYPPPPPPGKYTMWKTFPLKEYHMSNLPPEEIPWQNFPKVGNNTI